MKEATKSYFQEHGPWYAITILLLIGTIVAGYYLFSDEESTPPSKLKVEEVYFVMTDQDQEHTDMDILVFITNDGKTSLSEVTARAFAVETDSNLARDEAIKEMGTVKSQTTVEGTLKIELPNNETYRVELLIFKEGKLAIRGSGTVNLKGVGKANDYKTTEGDVARSGDDEGTGLAEDDASSMCGIFVAVIIIVALIVIIILIQMGQQKGKARSKERISYPSQFMQSEYVVGESEQGRLCLNCGMYLGENVPICLSCGFEYYPAFSGGSNEIRQGTGIEVTDEMSVSGEKEKGIERFELDLDESDTTNPE